MKILTLFKKSLYLIKLESELWINYSAGINHKFNLARSKTPWYLSGIVPRVLMSVRWLLKRFSFSKANKTNSSIDIFIFAETLNQWTSLKSTVLALGGSSLNYELYIDQSIAPSLSLKATANINVCSFKFSQIIVGFVICLSRFLWLILTLRKINPELISRRLNGFLSVYFWVPFFWDRLTQSSPKIVLCSNDHNAANRSLLLVAKYLKIQTAYIQHASVSTRFHKLDFDYSFLDGKNAYETYLLCEKNTNKSLINNRVRWVFLSGVKRPLITEHKKYLQNDAVGLAFKESDGIEQVFKLCAFIVKSGKKVFLRYHPATSQITINRLKKFVEGFDGCVYLNSPYTSPVNEYLASIKSVVASNSTLLLEAAIVDVKSIYYEFGPAVTPDYYGYVDKGISFQAKSFEEIVELVEGELPTSPSRVEAIQQYSYTYAKKWQNREGELVASILKDIIGGEEVEKLWGALKFELDS